MSAGRPVGIVLVGIGGMGAVYVDELLKPEFGGLCEIRGAVDPAPERCPRMGELRILGVPFYRDLAAFYERHQADLAVISSPIQCHAAQTIAALKAGSRVLCEKPLAGTAAEGRAMAEAEEETGLWAAVGYQWSFSPAIQALKADILGGRFGRPRRLHCLYHWPRPRAYYERNDWAGRLRSADGGWVLDGPANNAMGHDLHNIFYILGPEVDRSAFPVRVQAELYRANPIENYDTAAARFAVAGGAEVAVWFSHVTRTDRGPVMRFEFERGRLESEGRGTPLRADFRDGSTAVYGDPDAAPMKKLRDAIEGVLSGRRPVCGVRAAQAQTLAVNGMQASAGDPLRFAEASLRRDRDPAPRMWVEGLEEDLTLCYEKGLLPSELGLDWARPGRLLELDAAYSFAPGPAAG